MLMHCPSPVGSEGSQLVYVRLELECCQRNPLVVLVPPDHVEQKRGSEQTSETDIHLFICLKLNDI